MKVKDKNRVAEKKSWRRFLTPTAAYFSSLFLVSAVSVWIRTGMPVHAIGNAAYDDLLFIRLASYLGAGKWLGPYDQLTLAKGMFYPLFILLAYLASVPLKIAEQIVYLAASGLAAEFVRRRTRNNYFAGGLCALLAFNPVLWNQNLARVIREGLYISLSLAVVVLFVMIAFPNLKEGRIALLGRALAGMSLGVLGGAFWLTREEGVWIVPALAVALLIAALGIFMPRAAGREHSAQLDRRAQWKVIALPFALTLGCFAAVDLSVAGLNFRHYGIFETSDYRSKSFLRAYGALTRIQHNEWQPYVLFPKDARERAYSVSPAARELQPSFEGTYGETWRQISCAETHTSPCPEVLSGWFMWELQGAVANAGHYRTAPEAMKFYDALADQIGAGCASREIECLPERDTLSPRFRPEFVGRTLKVSESLIKPMFTLREGPVGSPPSTGPVEGLSVFSHMVGGVSPPDQLATKLVIQGWAGAISGTPTVQLASRGSGEFLSSTSILPAKDVLARYPELQAVRFNLETNCPPAACDLIVGAPGVTPAKISVSRLAPSSSFGAPALRLAIDNVSLAAANSSSSPRQNAQVRTASVISSGYAIGLPILSLLGAAGLLLAAASKRIHAIPLEFWALAIASVVAVCTRLALLAYITATSFPAANLLYISPASPFVMIFAAVGVYCGYVTLWGTEGRFRTKTEAPALELSRV